jgi:hypothetical protein
LFVFSNNADNLTEREREKSRRVKFDTFITYTHTHRKHNNSPAAVEAMKKTPPTSGRAFTEYDNI